jgi:hypothetical protein
MAVMGCEAPKLRLVANAVVATSEADRVALIKAEQHLDEVVILGPYADPREAPMGRLGHSPVSGTLTLTRYQPDQLNIEVTNPSNEPVWLVYSDAHDPGWSARVDNQPVPIHLAYGAFKAVEVPPGTHLVVFEYDGRWYPILTDILRLTSGFFFIALTLAMIVLPGLAMIGRRKADRGGVARQTLKPE